MPVALALVGDDHAALPDHLAGGWFRLRRPRGRKLVWAVLDLPAIGLVSAWRSRQQAEEGQFNRATVLPAAEFAASADPVEAAR